MKPTDAIRDMLPKCRASVEAHMRTLGKVSEEEWAEMMKAQVPEVELALHNAAVQAAVLSVLDGLFKGINDAMNILEARIDELEKSRA